MADGLVLAILGAESTGKTQLSQALVPALAQQTGLRCTWVGEALREWCDQHQRTPRQEEQLEIMALQAQRIEAAQAGFDLVVADTTPVMTAVYHWQVFGDNSLDEPALQWHGRHCLTTLVTGLDLPWQADGLQRDGPHVREPVDQRLTHLLRHANLGYARVMGIGAARLEAALNALNPNLRKALSPQASGGLFSRLAERDAQAKPWRWACDCDDPVCEHALRQ